MVSTCRSLVKHLTLFFVFFLLVTSPNARFSNGRHINGLNASYLNARSLKAFATGPDQPNATSKVCKIALLQRLVYSAKYDFVYISETWLNDSVLNSEPLPGYCGFRHTPSRIL